MKTFLALALLLNITTSEAVMLKPGDVVLISHPCFMCSLIELEGGMPYSHGGVIVNDQNGRLSVLEALNQIDRVPLEIFLARRRKGTEALFLRPKLRGKFATNSTALNTWLIQRFNIQFVGRAYDTEFLWNNSNASGEKYYCSEFIVKLLNPVLIEPVGTRPMHFNHYREYWIKYFRNTAISNPPDGKPGVSPAEIAKNPSFSAINH